MRNSGAYYDIKYKMKKYNKKLPYSYTLGAFPTIELLKKYPKKVMKVFTHSDLNSVTQEEIITGICNANNIFLNVTIEL